MYVTSADIRAGAPVMPNTDVFTCTSQNGGGGWVRAEYWWTRTAWESVTQQSASALTFVKPDGTVPETGYKLTVGLANYNNHPVTALQSTGPGAGIIGSFGI